MEKVIRVDPNTEDSEIEFETFNWGPPLVSYNLTDEELHVIKEQTSLSSTTFPDHSERLAGKIEKQLFIPVENASVIFSVIQKYLLSYTKFAWGEFFLQNQPHSKLYSKEKKDAELKSFFDKIVLQEMWINHMKAGDYSPLHDHSHHVAFTLYTEIPKILQDEYDNQYKKSKSNATPGYIQFVYGTAAASIHKAVTSHLRLPKVGELFIFPNYLSHQVYPFECEGTRTSIAGNISYEI